MRPARYFSIIQLSNSRALEEFIQNNNHLIRAFIANGFRYNPVFDSS